MSHLPDGAQAAGGGGGAGGGTPKTSFKMPSMKSSLHDLVQVCLIIQRVVLTLTAQPYNCQFASYNVTSIWQACLWTLRKLCCM